MATTEANARVWSRAAGVVAAMALIALVAPAPALSDALTTAIDGLYDVRDKLQDTVMKSVKGVADAMNEGAPAPSGPGESAIDYQLRMYDRLDRFYRGNDRIFRAQQQLLNIDAQLLQKLPKGDPRRAEVTKDLVHIGTQQAESRKAREDFRQRRQAFHDLIQDYKQHTGSYPPHNCAAAPGWHLPAGASCDGASPPSDPHAGSSGHAP